MIAPHSTKARIAKAEALYSMGQFEKVVHSVWEGGAVTCDLSLCQALVEFEKGWRLRQDPEIKTGIVKCRDVILNTVGEGRMGYDDKVDLISGAKVSSVDILFDLWWCTNV